MTILIIYLEIPFVLMIEIRTIDDEYLFQENIMHHNSTGTVTASTIKREISFYDELSRLKEYVLNGKFRDPKLFLQEGILFRGQLVNILKKIQELHSTQVGMPTKYLKLKQIRCCQLNEDITKMIARCVLNKFTSDFIPNMPIHCDYSTEL